MNLKRSIWIVIATFALLLGVVGAGLVAAQGPEEGVLSILQDEMDEEDELEGEDEPITGEALDPASAAALEYLGEGRVTDTEVGDEEGYYEIEVTLDDGRQVDVHLDEDFNVLGEEADSDEAEDADEDDEEDVLEGEDEPITGDALDLASAAALEYTGEGRVTDTEVGDEEGYYEVEVTLDNGQQVDVHLDENFNVLGQEADSDEVED